MKNNCPIPYYHVTLLMMMIVSIGFKIAQATIRKDFYDYFDPFYFKELINDLERQYNTRTCSISNGPYCYSLISLETFKISKEEISKQNIHSLSQYLEEQTQFIYNRIKEAPNYIEPININSKYEYTLLLTMESFDEITNKQDTFMPSEMVVPYNNFYLILNFVGKIRLTSDHSAQESDDIPSLTYGVVEETDIEIRFNRPLLMIHIYVRKPKDNDNNSNGNEGFFNLTGYIKTQIVYVKHEQITNEWKKILFDEKIIDSIRIEKDIAFDNMKIVYKSGLDPHGDEVKNKDLIKQLKKALKGEEDNKEQNKTNQPL